MQDGVPASVPQSGAVHNDLQDAVSHAPLQAGVQQGAVADLLQREEVPPVAQDPVRQRQEPQVWQEAADHSQEGEQVIPMEPNTIHKRTELFMFKN